MLREEAGRPSRIFSASWARDDDISRYLKALPNWLNLQEERTKGKKLVSQFHSCKMYQKRILLHLQLRVSEIQTMSRGFKGFIPSLERSFSYLFGRLTEYVNCYQSGYDARTKGGRRQRLSFDETVSLLPFRNLPNSGVAVIIYVYMLMAYAHSSFKCQIS